MESLYIEETWRMDTF